jgi:hypothetical protein
MLVCKYRGKLVLVYEKIEQSKVNEEEISELI